MRIFVVLTVIAASLLVASGTSAAPGHGLACRQLYFKASTMKPVFYRGTCLGNILPQAYVNGHPLQVEDIFNNTASFYGYQTVVRLHQYKNKTIAITVETASPRTVTIRVRCTHYFFT